MINSLNVYGNKQSFNSKISTDVAYNNNNIVDSIISSAGIKESKDYAAQGDEFLKKNDFDEAVSCYKKSIELRPEFKDTYLLIGKAYNGRGDYKEAASSIETYLSQYADDTDSIILLGECYRNLGQYQKALIQFEKAAVIDSENDLAKRNIEETKNNIMACYDPKLAHDEKRKQSLDNLNKAISMAKDYLPNGYLKDMGDLTVVFDKTAKMGGTSNIAQYEHSKRKITVSDTYIYAAPQIVTAYLVHEFVHAKDNDSYTSVREEQDAYRKATVYWGENAKGVKDPEMDYAADLYKQSPETLDKRVAEIYRLRDPKIADTSPNHPPKNEKIAAGAPIGNNSSQPLKTYDVIS